MRFLLYKDYESGFANDVLSVEMGVALAALTRRTLVLYGSADEDGRLQPLRGGHSWLVPERRRALIDMARRPSIVDLLDPLPVPTLGYTQYLQRQREAPLAVHDSDVHLPGAAFIAQPGLSRARVAAFAAGRPTFGDPTEAVWHLSRCNLAYYSRTVYPVERPLLHTLAGVRVREPYRQLADKVARALGRFNGAHVRLTDFRQFLPHQVADYPGAVLQTLQELCDPRLPLVISSDESDNAEFFAGIKAAFPRTVFVDEFIVDHFADEFRALEFTDETAFGVVCNLVMRHADQFVGTPGSTFSGVIHRAWGQRARARALPLSALTFRYLTSGSADGEVPFAQGAYAATGSGPFSWNRITLPRPTDMQSWYREWPEACAPSSELPDMPAPATAVYLPAREPAERPSNDEIEAGLLADPALVLPASDAPVRPLQLSEAITGRSHWVRWTMAALAALQLALMWWPRT